MRFPDVGTRDMVRSSAFNLADKNAGIRLEIPDTLRPSLRALESLAYNLRKANPEMKRNVKFDDEFMDLVMDVKLNENATWRKIRPGRALAVKIARRDSVEENEMTADELQSSMQGSGGPATGVNAFPQGSS